MEERVAQGTVGGTTSRDWRRLRAAAGLTGAVLLFATACSSGGAKSSANAGEAGKTVDVASPQITITPADGSGKAQPDKGITVTAANGTLDTVAVQLKGQTVPGTLSADKTSWKSDWTLKPDSSYTVSASAKNSKKSATATTAPCDDVRFCALTAVAAACTAAEIGFCPWNRSIDASSRVLFDVNSWPLAGSPSCAIAKRSSSPT